MKHQENTNSGRYQWPIQLDKETHSELKRLALKEGKPIKTIIQELIKYKIAENMFRV